MHVAEPPLTTVEGCKRFATLQENPFCEPEPRCQYQRQHPPICRLVKAADRRGSGKYFPQRCNQEGAELQKSINLRSCLGLLPAN